MKTTFDIGDLVRFSDKIDGVLIDYIGVIDEIRIYSTENGNKIAEEITIGQFQGGKSHCAIITLNKKIIKNIKVLGKRGNHDK